MPTRKIVDLLNEDHRPISPLQRLLRTASNQRQWTTELRAVLPDDLAPHVTVTQIKPPFVHIQCANAAMATRMRFQWPDTIAALHNLNSFQRVTDCKLHVHQP